MAVRVLDCSQAQTDATAKAVLSGLPQQPFEYGVTFMCIRLTGTPNAIESQHLTHSFAPDQAQDPCRVKPWNDPGEMNKDNAIKGIGHTHPLFYDPDEYNAGIGCGGAKADVSLLDLAILNTLNEASSDGDKTSHIFTQADDYLGTPFRDAVKVMREGSLQESTLP